MCTCINMNIQTHAYRNRKPKPVCVSSYIHPPGFSSLSLIPAMSAYLLSITARAGICFFVILCHLLPKTGNTKFLSRSFVLCFCSFLLEITLSFSFLKVFILFCNCLHVIDCTYHSISTQFPMPRHSVTLHYFAVTSYTVKNNVYVLPLCVSALL